MSEPLTLHILDDKAAFNEAAAKLLVKLAQAAVAERGCFSIALSGGGTPSGVYELLAERPYRDEIPWQHTHVFWGDERLVPPDDDGSNYKQAAELLLRKVTIPAENIHRVQGEADRDTAVADYTEQLKILAIGNQPPIFDLILLGMGSDGHTASLFPGSPVAQREWVVGVTADYDGRPAERLTLTPTVINQARHIIFLVAGSSKTETLQKVLYGPQQPETLPAQRIQPVNGTLTWLTDREAAAELSQLTNFSKQ